MDPGHSLLATLGSEFRDDGGVLVATTFRNGSGTPP